ncbi:MFS transporter [Allostreptomyces psammosilenae]|uniref:MFS family permease n=1 Tax=Allostreptomyces psammosilenae TaxID=1892865 RepID=A0A853A1D6_9ACTN|nr:MFS transporter [Allostreptomyces psammosilenae]NYI08215.1 MFS family permease [Allostreptomyces psammosilenae]
MKLDTSRATPRVRHARRAITLTSFIHSAVYTSWVARIPQVQDALGLSTAELSEAFLGLTFGPLLSIPLVGWATHRYGSRVAVRLTLLASCVTLGLPALAGNLATLFVCLALFSAATAGLSMALNAHGVTVQAHYRRPMFATVHAANSFGGVLGSVAGAIAAAASVPPATHLGCAAALCTVVGIVSTRWLLPGASDRGVDRRPRGLSLPDRQTLTGPLLGLGMLALCVIVVESAVTNWSAIYLSDGLGAGTAVASAGFIVFASAMATGRMFADRVGARFGTVRTVRTAATVAALTLITTVTIGHPVAAIIGLAVLGAGLSALVPATMRAAGELPDVPRAGGIAAVSTAGYLGGLAGPASFGFTAGVVGLSGAFAGMALLVLLAAGLAGILAVARASVPTAGGVPEQQIRAGNVEPPREHHPGR